MEPWEEFMTFWGVDANALCSSCDFKAFAGLIFTGKNMLAFIHPGWGNNVLARLVNTACS